MSANASGEVDWDRLVWSIRDGGEGRGGECTQDDNVKCKKNGTIVEYTTTERFKDVLLTSYSLEMSFGSLSVSCNATLAVIGK